MVETGASLWRVDPSHRTVFEGFCQAPILMEDPLPPPGYPTSAERVLARGRLLVGDQDVTDNAKRQIRVFCDDLANLRQVFDLLGHRAVLKRAIALSGFHHSPHKSMKGSLRRQLDLIAIELPVGSHQYITERLRLGDEHSVKRITMVERESPQAAGIFCSEWQRFDPRG